MKILNVHRHGVRKLVFLAMALLAGSSHAILPDNLTIDVGDFDHTGSDKTVVLNKRSIRSATHYQVYTWSDVDGYVSQTPFEVRTYRGYVQSEPSLRVNGSVMPDGTLDALFTRGRENLEVLDENDPDFGEPLLVSALPITVTGPEGTFDPGSGNVVIPRVVNRVSPSPGGYTLPKYTMRRILFAFDVQYDLYEAFNFDLEAVIARVEQKVQDLEQGSARDLGLAIELTTIVVRTTPPVGGGAFDRDWAESWNDGLIPGNPIYNQVILIKKDKGALAGARLFNENETALVGKAGGRIGSGDDSFWGKSMNHEILGHNTSLPHGIGYRGLMGNRSCTSFDEVQRVLSHLNIGSEVVAPAIVYGGPLQPYAMVDLATVAPGQTVDIDLLDNDYDGNGDAISLHSVDSSSHNGGSIAVVSGGIVRYTPPVGFMGQDEFSYVLEDATGLLNSDSGYVKVYVHDGGLASHYKFEETSGELLHDSGPFQAHAEIYGGIAPSESAGRVGNAFSKPAGSSADAKAFADTTRTGDPMDGDFSVSIWVKYGATPTEDGAVVSKGGVTASDYFGTAQTPGWSILHDSGGGFRFAGATSSCSYDSTDAFDLKWNHVIEPDTWYHLVMTMDRSTQRLRAWVNNVEVTATTCGNHIPDGWIYNEDSPLTLLSLRRDTGVKWSGPGRVDELKIYHKALTEAEVTELYENPWDAPVVAGQPEWIEDLPAQSLKVGEIKTVNLDSFLWDGGDKPLTFEVMSGGGGWMTFTGQTLVMAPDLGDEGAYQAVIRATDSTGDWDETTISVDVENTSDLVSQWAMDGSGGTVVEPHGGFYISLVGGAQQGVVGGKYSGALSLDGTGDYGLVSDLGLSGNEVTICGWIKHDGSNTGVQRLLMTRSIGVTGLSLDDDYELEYYWNGDSSSWSFSSGIVIPSNQWTFVAMVIEPTQATLYAYDGTTAQSATNAISHASVSFASTTTYIGRDPSNTSRDFKGQMDDFRTYNKALTPLEIAELYQSPTPVITPTADAGEDIIAGIGTGPVTLDGSNSSSPNGLITSYIWRVGGLEVASGIRPTYAAPTGSTTVELTITDASGASATDQVNVEVRTLGETLRWDRYKNQTGIQDLDGEWNLSNSRWKLEDDSNVLWQDGNTASIGFDTTVDRLLTIMQDVTPSGLEFNTTGGGNYTIDGAFSIIADETVNLEIVTDSDATIATVMDGAGSITKTGPGTLTIDTPNNDMPYSGTITIDEGEIALAGNVEALRNASHIVVNPGATFRLVQGMSGNNQLPSITLAGGTFIVGNNHYLSNVLTLQSGTTNTITVNGSATLKAGGYYDILSSGGDLVKDGPGTLHLRWHSQHSGSTLIKDGIFSISGSIRQDRCTDWTIEGGSLVLYSDSGGRTRNMNSSSIITMLGGAFELNDNNETIGGLEGSAGIIQNPELSTDSLLQVDNDTPGSSSFGGVIQDGAGVMSFTKSGSGTQLFSGLNTYTGATTVEDGVLGGTGSLSSPTTVQAGGTLAPGANGIGTFTINNTLTLQGTVLAEVNASTDAADRVQGVSTLTYGGTLTVSNLDGTLAAGDSFTLFSATSYAGSFTTINLPTLGVGLVWNTTLLGVNGSISVDAATTYTLTYTAGAGGTISGTSPQIVADGASGSAVTAVPDTGYLFVDWSDGSTENPRTDLDVTEDLNVTANFVVAAVEIVNFMFQDNTDFAAFVDGDGPITATGISGIANGEAFTFDVTVSAVSGNGDGHIDFKNQDIMFDADSGQNRANSLTLTVSNFSGAPGQTYGGIVGVNKYDFQGGDDWDIAGQTISGADATYTTLTSPVLGAMTINTIDNAPGANGPSKLRGFSISVSTDGSLEEVGTITVGGTATLPGGGEGLILSWTGFSGQNYSVESRTNLMIGNWEPYTNATGVYTNIPGTGGGITVTTTVDNAEEFYQVIAE